MGLEALPTSPICSEDYFRAREMGCMEAEVELLLERQNSRKKAMKPHVRQMLVRQIFRKQIVKDIMHLDSLTKESGR